MHRVVPPKLNCKILEGKNDESLFYVPRSTKALGTELSHERLIIQFADL